MPLKMNEKSQNLGNKMKFHKQDAILGTIPMLFDFAILTCSFLKSEFFMVFVVNVQD